MLKISQLRFKTGLELFVHFEHFLTKKVQTLCRQGKRSSLTLKVRYRRATLHRKTEFPVRAPFALRNRICVSTRNHESFFGQLGGGV